MTAFPLHTKVTVALLFAVAVCAQTQERVDTVDEPSSTGFGLQSSIFRYVQNTSVDLSRNLSDARNYVMTPGDTFTLTMSYGMSLSREEQQTSVSYQLQLSEDHTLEIPVIGEISVDGFDLLSLRSFVSSQLKIVIPLQHVSLVLSKPAQFNVFVYGNVNRPGFLTANPMLRVIDAIALSGGFKSDGSYRNIILERSDRTVSVDISRFYSVADFESNPVLQPGDIIFVPAAKRVVTIQGEIKYPGRYELVEGDNLKSVVNLAGGFLPAAESESIDLVRQNEANRPLTIRVASSDFATFEMKNGDIVRVRSSADNLLRVAIEGAVWGRRVSAAEAASVPTSPVRVDLPYYDSMTLLDVLEEVGGPTPFAEAERSFVIRAGSDTRLPVDIGALWESRNADGGVRLEPGDTIVVPMQVLDVFVTGMVVSPGRVSYRSGYTVNDYILLAGGFDPRRASAQALFLVNDRGRRRATKRDAVVPRGSTIYVGRKMLFFVDDTVQNILLGAAWVTSTIAVVTSVVQFIDLFFPGVVP